MLEQQKCFVTLRITNSNIDVCATIPWIQPNNNLIVIEKEVIAYSIIRQWHKLRAGELALSTPNKHKYQDK